MHDLASYVIDTRGYLLNDGSIVGESNPLITNFLVIVREIPFPVIRLILESLVAQ